MEKYKVVQCPKCGRYQITSSDERMSCKYCDSSSKLFSKGGDARVRVLDSFDHPKKANLYVRKLREKKRKS